MQTVATALICLASLINLGPVVGVFSTTRLQALYGVPFEEPNLVTLMRHRAILFGLVGGLLLASAFYVALRPAAYVAGFVSMVSFVLIAWQVGEYNQNLRRVIVVDLVGITALGGALVIDCIG